MVYTEHCDLKKEFIYSNHLQSIAISILSKVALLFLLTLSFASCISCQIWIALVSPRDLREQNSPSVVVPEIKKEHVRWHQITYDTFWENF